MKYSATDFVSAFFALLPPGRLLQESAIVGGASALNSLAEVLGNVLENQQENHLHAAILEAIPNADSGYPSDLLAQWERLLDLPDCCIADPSALSAADRTNAILAKLAGVGAPLLSKYVGMAELYGYTTRGVHGWRVSDGCSSSHGVGGGGTWYSGAAEDRHGVAGGADKLVCNNPNAFWFKLIDKYMAAHENTYGEVWLYSPTGVNVTVDWVDSDGSTLATESIALAQEWVKVSFYTDDLGGKSYSGGMQIKITAASTSIIYACDWIGGFRDRFFESFGAGIYAGAPVGGDQARFTWGIEYGDDLVDRDSADTDSPNWQVTSPGSISLADCQSPVSRYPAGDTFTPGASPGDDISFEFSDPGTDSTRLSLWLRGTEGSTVDLEYTDRAGTPHALATETLRNGWQKFAYTLDLGTGAGTLDVTLTASDTNDIEIAHVNLSEINPELECRITKQAQDHTKCLFGSYGCDGEYNIVGEFGGVD